MSDTTPSESGRPTSKSRRRASVVIDEPRIEGSTITCSVTPPRRLRRFFTGEPFRAEYDIDLAGVPPAIATIPVLAHVSPVAWANGADVRVSTADETFLTALAELRDVLCGMYPRFMRGGEVVADRPVDVGGERPPPEFEGVGLLFSGGVDSVASFVRRRHEDPTLISVQGWVIGADEADRWAGAQRSIRAFADEHGVDARAIRSNMLSFLDSPMLQAHYKRYVDGAWYSSVGHGLGLLGLCAPLSYGLGLGTLHVAATHTEEFSEPWGSHPDIDDRVRWAHTRGNHEGYGLSRQEKIELIADYLRAEGRPLVLRTCTNAAAGDNCSECEKCYRTMCGLVLAGLDPNEHGYDVDQGTFDEIRAAFERGAFVMGEDERFMWRDLKRHADPAGTFPIDGASEFFAWLSEEDVDALAASSTPPLHHVLLRAVARHLPFPAYASLYPVYRSLKRARGSK